MSRHFDRSFPPDFVTLAAAGTSGEDGGPVTVLAVFRADSSAVDQGIVQFRTVAGNNVIALAPISDAHLWVSVGNTGRQIDAYAAGNWYLAGFTKAAGTSAIRGHICAMAIDTWTHTDYLTAADSINTPVDHIYLGRCFNDYLGGDIAAVGIWNSVLSDLAIEALRPGLAAWYNSSPVALWGLNQSSVATPIPDLIGDADQTAIDGTSVQAAEPPNWSYTLAAPVNGQALLLFL